MKYKFETIKMNNALIKRIRHNKYAPIWAITLVVLCTTGLSTNWINLGNFWTGYVLDITGPAWSYILFRRLFTSYKENAWTNLFTPKTTFIVIILICFGIETSQYLDLYKSTFDPWDYLAYISIIFPIFLLDSSNWSDGKRD